MRGHLTYRIANVTSFVTFVIVDVFGYVTCLVTHVTRCITSIVILVRSNSGNISALLANEPVICIIGSIGG